MQDFFIMIFLCAGYAGCAGLTSLHIRFTISTQLYARSVYVFRERIFVSTFCFNSDSQAIKSA